MEQNRRENCHGKIPVREVISELDRLLDMDLPGEAKKRLEAWQKRARELGDWGGELTVCNELMGLTRSTGDRRAGLAAAERGLFLVSLHGMEETVTAGTTFINAGTTLKAFGKCQEGLPLYEKAERVYRANLRPDDYRFAGLYNNMALALGELGEFQRAKERYQKALETLEELPGAELEISVTLVNLACLYRDWQNEEGRGRDRGTEPAEAKEREAAGGETGAQEPEEERCGRRSRPEETKPGGPAGTREWMERWENKISSCLETAWEYFNRPGTARDGYYAFNCRKCAKTFGSFGYFRIERELLARAERIYAARREEKGGY